MSKALLFNADCETEETAKFVGMFDKFFDCLNVSNFHDGILHRKSFQYPYRNANDNRLKVLKINLI